MTKFKYNPVRFSIFAMFLTVFLNLKTVDSWAAVFGHFHPKNPVISPTRQSCPELTAFEAEMTVAETIVFLGLKWLGVSWSIKTQFKTF